MIVSFRLERIINYSVEDVYEVTFCSSILRIGIFSFLDVPSFEMGKVPC